MMSVMAREGKHSYLSLLLPSSPQKIPVGGACPNIILSVDSFDCRKQLFGSVQPSQVQVCLLSDSFVRWTGT